MIDCKTCQERLLDWLDSDLGPDEGDDLESHLATCGSCAPEAFALVRTRRAVGLAVRFEAPPARLDLRVVESAIREGLLEPSGAANAIRPRRQGPSWAAAILAVVVASAASWLFARSGPGDRERPGHEVADSPRGVDPSERELTTTHATPPDETGASAVRRLWSAAAPGGRAASEPDGERDREAPDAVRGFWTASLAR